MKLIMWLVRRGVAVKLLYELVLKLFDALDDLGGILSI